MVSSVLGGGDARNLQAWQRANIFYESLEDICAEMDLGRDKEWLLYLIREVGRSIPEAIADGWQRESVAETLLSMYEAQSALEMIAYYLVFLGGEGFLAESRVAEVDKARLTLESMLSGLIDAVRDERNLRTRNNLN